MKCGDCSVVKDVHSTKAWKVMPFEPGMLSLDANN